MNIRCKFKCVETGKRVGWGNNKFLHSVVMSPVSDGSPENKAFFEATPNGKLEFSSVVPDAFEVGKEYYLDITPA